MQQTSAMTFGDQHHHFSQQALSLDHSGMLPAPPYRFAVLHILQEQNAGATIHTDAGSEHGGSRNARCDDSLQTIDFPLQMLLPAPAREEQFCKHKFPLPAGQRHDSLFR